MDKKDDAIAFAASLIFNAAIVAVKTQAEFAKEA
jgi:hypothetical protein